LIIFLPRLTMKEPDKASLSCADNPYERGGQATPRWRLCTNR
jgi:hypothetical protein